MNLLRWPASPLHAVQLADFYARNAAHLAPWEPRREGITLTARQVELLSEAATHAAEGTGFRWLLSDDGVRVVGLIGVNNVVRGFHHSATLGYALDASLQGRGLMHEALASVIAEVFGPPIQLHRLQAAWRPENARSGRLLQRLGFRQIGLARDYLQIDGAWRDHVLSERLNDAFEAPGARA
jgi:[ribosomal protein S5]-alanine N-acetyltransferase